MSDFGRYAKRIPDQKGPHWAVENNVLFCENFPKNSDTPQPDHFQAVTDILVPFCYDAIKALGNPVGSKWTLNVLGQASSTGNPDTNKELSRRRALSLGEFAVAEFEAYWWGQGERPEDLPTIVPRYVAIGDKLARKEPSAQSKAPASYVEDRQGAYRSVLFPLNAAGNTGREIREGGKIRSVAGAELKPNLEPLDKTIADLKVAYDSLSGFNTVIQNLLKTLGYNSFASLLGPLAQNFVDVLSSLQKHPAFVLGRFMVKVMIPHKATYGYQMYDDYGGKKTAPIVYRFDGSENASSVGLLELVSLYAKLDGVLGALKSMQSALDKANLPFDIGKAILDMTLIKKQVYTVLVRIGGLFGKRGETFMAHLLSNYDSFGSGLLISTSDWTDFVYHPSTHNLTVQKMAGQARRFKAGGLYSAGETLEFGGGVDNNWRDFNASSTIRSVNPLSNSFLEAGWAHGTLKSLGSRVVLD